MSRKSAYRLWWCFQPYEPPTLYSAEILFFASDDNFCYRLSKFQGLLRLEGLGKLKKFSHLIGALTRNLPACSIAPNKIWRTSTKMLMTHAFDALGFSCSSFAVKVNFSLEYSLGKLWRALWSYVEQSIFNKRICTFCPVFLITFNCAVLGPIFKQSYLMLVQFYKQLWDSISSCAL
jgi:hypothetical protein